MRFYILAVLFLSLFFSCTGIAIHEGSPEPGIVEIAEANDFYIGTAVAGPVSSESQKLFEKFVLDEQTREYNYIVPENALKWNRLLKDQDRLYPGGNEPVEDYYDFSTADRIVAEATTAGVRIRGHVLIWARVFNSKAMYPTGIELALEGLTPQEQKSKLLEIMENHISAVVTRYAGLIDTWDVVNEHLHCRDDRSVFYRVLGDEYVSRAFDFARQACIEAGAVGTRLIWNETLADYGSEAGLLFRELLQDLKTDNVPIDGVGIQGHSIQRLHDIQSIELFLSDLEKMGLICEITEFDCPIRHFPGADMASRLEAQGDYFYRYIKAVLQSGICSGITFWGTSDDYTWLDTLYPFNLTAPNSPLLIDMDHNRKPAYYRVKQALEEYFENY